MSAGLKAERERHRETEAEKRENTGEEVRDITSQIKLIVLAEGEMSLFVAMLNSYTIHSKQ